MERTKCYRQQFAWDVTGVEVQTPHICREYAVVVHRHAPYWTGKATSVSVAYYLTLRGAEHMARKLCRYHNLRTYLRGREQVEV